MKVGDFYSRGFIDELVFKNPPITKWFTDSSVITGHGVALKKGVYYEFRFDNKECKIVECRKLSLEELRDAGLSLLAIDETITKPEKKKKNFKKTKK